jgi:hypothetical protein
VNHYCPSCGRAFEVSFRFCPYDSTPLSTEPAGSSKQPTPPPMENTPTGELLFAGLWLVFAVGVTVNEAALHITAAALAGTIFGLAFRRRPHSRFVGGLKGLWALGWSLATLSDMWAVYQGHLIEGPWSKRWSTAEFLWIEFCVLAIGGYVSFSPFLFAKRPQSQGEDRYAR